jgi:DNA-binding transcriptional ArsR family regulator
MQPAVIFEIQAELCRTMSSAIRVEIIYLLHQSPMYVNEIAQATGHPKNVISRHLGVLRMGGIVTAQRHGQEIVYQIANPKIVQICNLMRELLAEEASRRSKLVEGFSNEHSG